MTVLSPIYQPTACGMLESNCQQAWYSLWRWRAGYEQVREDDALVVRFDYALIGRCASVAYDK